MTSADGAPLRKRSSRRNPSDDIDSGLGNVCTVKKVTDLGFCSFNARPMISRT